MSFRFVGLMVVLNSQVVEYVADPPISALLFNRVLGISDPAIHRYMYNSVFCVILIAFSICFRYCFPVWYYYL